MSEQQPKIMIFITILLSFSLEVTQSYQDCSTTQRLTDHYWSVQEQACLPCTRCHDQRLITLIGCAPDKDALCGTIEDLRHQWLLPSLRNGGDISPNFVAGTDSRTMKTKKAVPEDEVYGRTRYAEAPASGDKYYDATQKVRESVRNASQKKNEFLRKLQEIEQISVSKKVKQEADEVDGTVHFSEDEFFRHADADDLHQDLEIIEQELLRENEASSSPSTTFTTSIQTTTEELVTTPPPIPVWFNGNEGVLEAHDKSYISTTTDPSSEDFIVGHQQFFAKTDFQDKGDVYGAVVQEPPAMDKSKLSGHVDQDEFGLLKQILYKEPASSNSDKVSYVSVKLEHILVIVGFCIGFSLVFCVALVYYKTKPGMQRRFPTLNNHSVEVRAQDASSMSSGNSSFQQTDSRLTSLTASPLLSQAQSPCVLPRIQGQASHVTSPVINREDISPSVLNIPQSNRHSVYVDQRGRTSLGSKQSRELPV